MTRLPAITRDAPLAPLTTLGVGGPAWGLADAGNEDELRALLEHAHDAGRPVLILGGGSNLLVADAGFRGLVIRYAAERIELASEGERTRVRVEAGAIWDRLVALTVERGLAGIECLSGIPGRVGAAPMQNIGAYGQEVASALSSVTALCRASGRVVRLEAEACGFGYRESHFKGPWRDRYVITGIELLLQAGAPPTLAYPELAAAAGALSADPWAALAHVRRTVLAVRAKKAMVLDPGDPNTRSAGSFFLNPVVPRAEAERIAAGAEARIGRPMPRFETGGDRVKLSAAWLMEAAGLARGHRRGRAGISERHVLALVNTGGASAAELLALAREARQRVAEAFGVTLVPEPVFVGFEVSVDELLS